LKRQLETERLHHTEEINEILRAERNHKLQIEGLKKEKDASSSQTEVHPVEELITYYHSLMQRVQDETYYA
jgi:hypothetical protein